MKEIPQSHDDLLQDEVKAFTALSTVMEDGSLQVTPVWFSWDGKYVLINSAKGRVKDRNMRRNPNVGLLILDPRNSYRYLSIRGRVVDITEEGARDHISILNMKYVGNPNYGGPANEVRVIYKILPENVVVSG